VCKPGVVVSIHPPEGEANTARGEDRTAIGRKGKRLDEEHSYLLLVDQRAHVAKGEELARSGGRCKK